MYTQPNSLNQKTAFHAISWQQVKKSEIEMLCAEKKLWFCNMMWFSTDANTYFANFRLVEKLASNS